MKILRYFFLALCLCSAAGALGKDSRYFLKPQQPNWRSEIVEVNSLGAPKTIVFYQPILSEEKGELKESEVPVKQIFFYPSGAVQRETDLTEVSKDSKAYEIWKTTVVPHGVCLDFFEDGEIEKISYYENGLLDGEAQVFYSKNKKKYAANYKKGELDGSFAVFHENGNKSQDAFL